MVVISNIAAGWSGGSSPPIVTASGLPGCIVPLPYIYSYLDPPKTWEELQQNRGPGYDEHHVVERWSEKDGIPPSMIYSPDNEALIPTLRHWEINSWLDTPNAEFEDSEGNDMSPRQYLRGKSWEERRRIGMDALIRFGALKP